MRYVSLSCDHAPTYAAWAPVAARLWKRLGYDAIVQIEAAAWDSDFCRLVLDELRDAKVRQVERAVPLSVPNTMRLARLVAPAHADLDPNSFVLMADVDMLPLSRTFFADRDGLVALRAMYHHWEAIGNAGAAADIPESLLVPGSWRFAMCYAGATVAMWRELLGLIPGAPAASLAALVGERTDDPPDLDEIKMSAAFLNRASGAPLTAVSDGVWQKGELQLVDPVRAPLLSMYASVPRGMLRLQDLDVDAYHVRDERVIDFIPARFSQAALPFHQFGVARIYFPEEAEWLIGYESKLRSAIVTGGPSLWNA